MKWVASVWNGDGGICFVLCRWTLAELKIVVKSARMAVHMDYKWRCKC